MCGLLLPGKQSDNNISRKISPHNKCPAFFYGHFFMFLGSSAPENNAIFCRYMRPALFYRHWSNMRCARLRISVNISNFAHKPIFSNLLYIFGKKSKINASSSLTTNSFFLLFTLKNYFVTFFSKGKYFTDEMDRK